MIKNILVTGGAGFIGSSLVKYLTSKYNNYRIINIDALTYASNYKEIKKLEKLNNYSFHKLNINDVDNIEHLFSKYSFDQVIHLAAETHVDNSIKKPSAFVETNVVGTLNLLKIANKFWTNKENKLFYHISTDEVFGSLGQNGLFTEDSPYDPRSPYSASKAASDHLVRSFYHTYNLPIIVSNCSNNFGPNQHKEKLIPVVINSILNNQKIPVYGDGKNIRDWIYVEDHVKAIDKIIHNGILGETYLIGGDCEFSNIDLIFKIIGITDKILNRKKGKSEQLISYVEDRKGHDYRYAIDHSKLKNKLSWEPSKDFDKNLVETINWYINKSK
jgi:dTDP-glucose 4,6-dehydratase